MEMYEELTEISGTVEDVTFHNDENGFTVLDLSTEDELVTVVGVLPAVASGEKLRLRGNWTSHPTFGRQFRAQLCERSMPSTSAELYKYLASGAVSGIREKTARKIIERFGDDTFEVLEKHPEKLASIKGISIERARKMSNSFNEQFAVRQIMISLERYGMTPAECLKTYRALGPDCDRIVASNPYTLCAERIGIDFDRADAIAAALPEKPEPVFRMKAGVIHTVRHNLHNGHTCLPVEKLKRPCCSLLETDEASVGEIIAQLVEDKRLVLKPINGVSFVFLPEIYEAESSAAERIRIMLRFPPAGKPTLMRDIEEIEKDEGIVFDENQRDAIVTAVEKGILILTGGPGTGKTTTLNGIIRLYEKDGLRVLLAAPTGRAAKRMSEISGKEAKTIHRLLEVEWDKNDKPFFSRNMKNPLEADALIVDELSMVDVGLFASLVNALPLGCRLIMVGDSDQLPAVGAGNVLGDLISSGVLPVSELKKIFRQASKSRIVTNAHDIVAGRMPDLASRDNDFFFIKRTTPDATVRTVADLYAERLPGSYGYSPLENIQVLCPSRKGDTGSVRLNRYLQERVNPPAKGKNEVVFGGRIFREGDKVMQIKNNYDIMWSRGAEEGSGVFNGDIGLITEIDSLDAVLTVDFDGRRVEYGLDGLGELEHAFAVTVHKSQGNEFDAVIMPVMAVNPRLCYRNLLYTAVTRAKKLMILVGNEGTVREMTLNNSKTKRYSALGYFLKEEDGHEEE